MGCLIYELATGRALFTDMWPPNTARQQGIDETEGRIPPVSEIDADVRAD
jgi:hypothetical protein